VSSYCRDIAALICGSAAPTCAADANARLVCNDQYGGSPHCLAFCLIPTAGGAVRSTQADPGFVKHSRGDLTRYSWVSKPAMACAAHKRVSNPSTSGQLYSECTMRRNTAPLSPGLRPAGLAFSERPDQNAPLARPSGTAAADSHRVGTIWRPANTAPSTNHNPGLRREGCSCHPIYLKL
jgi:hypothetical protein